MKKFTLFMAAALSMFAANAVETVDELVGTYITSISGEYTPNYDATEDWSSWTVKGAVTIAKTGDNTITVTNLGNLGLELSGTVDLANGTITLNPYDDGKNYYACSGAPSEYGTDGYGKGLTDVTAPIVGTIAADGTITFNYVESYYTYISAIYTDVLKKASDPEMTVKGHISFYPYDEAAEDYSETPSLEGLEATLVKYAAADAADLGFLYELKIPGTWPGNVQFNVDENDAVVITNGYQPSGYEYQVMECYYFWSDLDEFFLDPEDSFFDGADTTEGLLYVGAWYYPDYYYDGETYSYGKIEFCWGALDSIDTVKADKDDENAPTFDIMGRKVTDTTAPGIYIKNGKKFVVF